MMRRARSTLLVLVACFVAWQALALLRVANRPLLASPAETIGALPSAGVTLVTDLLATTGRAAAGLAIGVVLGLAIGAAAAWIVRRAPALDGAFDFARSIPPVVLLPMFLLAFGWNESARVATVASGCVWTMALAATAAAKEPRSARRELLEIAGASPLEALRWTQPWEALPALAVGLRTSASLAVIVAVVTEMVAGAEHGVGARAVSAQIAGDTAALTLDVVGVGLVGWALNATLRWLEARARRVLDPSG